MPIELDLLDDLWAGVADELPRPDVTLAGPPDRLPAALPAGAAATATVATALAAAAALAGLRNGRTPALRVDRAHVAAAVRSERAFLVDGRPSGAGFAALSRFWSTGDGYVRTHANYPWHRAALLRVLELATDAEVDAVAAELARRSAGDVEDFVFAAGGIAARVRTGRDWAEHPQGRAVATEPLVSYAVVGPGRPRARPPGLRPADDVRVLDLTRVIAGPVCTRLLGALGADVLRIDPPTRNDIPPGTYADTLLGKRSAVLDLTRHADRAHALLEHADVLVCGYRPGALDRFGLTDADLAARHPGLVVVRLAAWGHTGPWRHRRGFDSVVQAGVGIADLEGDVAGPGALPCQLLDHGTGYLAAAAALDGLRRQADSGGTLVRRVSLARTAAWLLTAPRTPSTATADEALDDWTVRIGPVQAVAPPGAIDGQPLRWPGPPSRFLADGARWMPTL